ncbi:YitT family protein [Paenibacillus sp. GCM10027626]|uniref:YitT family protein n=1 Tax=Paenibacillus sp. GCM10027626 TaxID=3273411 RepID=UPI00362B2F09
MQKIIRPAAAMTIGALLIAFGFNQFIIPNYIITGGLAGVAMIIGYATHISIALMYFVLNIPIAVWGWRSLGRRFICWSIYSIIITTLALRLIPVTPIVGDALLGAVFGGVIVGFGNGLTLREGGSTGGVDIVASILTQKRDLSVGMLIFLLNSCIVMALGIISRNLDIALMSLVSIFTTAKVIDVIHVRHIKITAFIITCKSEALLAALLPRQRGITIVQSRGAYLQTNQEMLMTVTTRYELAELKHIISKTDPQAFVNLVETVGVIGDFRRREF